MTAYLQPPAGKGFAPLHPCEQKQAEQRCSQQRSRAPAASLQTSGSPTARHGCDITPPGKTNNPSANTYTALPSMPVSVTSVPSQLGRSPSQTCKWRKAEFLSADKNITGPSDPLESNGQGAETKQGGNVCFCRIQWSQWSRMADWFE
ncbi:hypothetical protein LDENG_00058140 [Lucifuga dentata]|nr:hypothetical protein LDENG_00058140 [Lucifuga dentata]